MLEGKGIPGVWISESNFVMFYNLPSACHVSAGGWSSSAANGAVQGGSPEHSAAGIGGWMEICMEIEGAEGDLLHSPLRNSRECTQRTENWC